MLAAAKKASIWISATLYTLILIVAIVLVLTAVLPLIEKMKEKSLFTKANNDMLDLDQNIIGVSSEGPGSQRVLPIQLQDGLLKVSNGMIYWEMLSKSDVIEPRTKISVGHLFIESNADVNATVSGNKTILENTKTKVEFDNTASNVDNIISKITNDDGNSITGGFSFKINSNLLPSVSSVSLEPGQGTNFGSATVVAKINSTLKIRFTLEGGADFLTINADAD